MKSYRAAIVPLMLVLGLCAGAPAWAQTYPQMAPLSRYLDTRQTEITLARSAAPATISDAATVLVLTKRGYETAAQGTNGFTCLVERAFMKHFEDPQFWNWRVRAPVCYNPAATRSIVPYTTFRTNLALAGVTKDGILDRLKTAIATKKLPGAEAGSMAYMMSKQQYLNDMTAPSWHPHVMFYAPASDGANSGASFGADLKGSPVIWDTSGGTPEPFTCFFVPVWKWSDGSPGPVAMMHH